MLEETKALLAQATPTEETKAKIEQLRALVQAHETAIGEATKKAQAEREAAQKAPSAREEAKASARQDRVPSQRQDIARGEGQAAEEAAGETATPKLEPMREDAEVKATDVSLAISEPESLLSA